MNLVKLCLVVFSSVNLLILGACGNSDQVTSKSLNLEKGVKKTEEVSNQKESRIKPDGHSEANQKGGQVVESGKYHLEFVPEKESKGTHLDFYLLSGDNHASVPNAKVTAQVQLPDGSKKTLNLAYDAKDKHYAALLPESVSGEYKVVILSDIKGEKINGRFSFKR